MAQIAAKQGDRINATDTHIVMVPSPTGEVPTPMEMPFSGVINQNVSRNVSINGQPAALQGSVAINTPPHVAPGGRFQREPSNRGEITTGSRSVIINGRPAARHGDTATTCNDPADRPVGRVEATGRVLFG